jgi:hypothetical protein
MRQMLERALQMLISQEDHAMRLALLGPAAPEKEGKDLRQAAEFALLGAAVDRAVYLGDDLAMQRVAEAWSAELSSPKHSNFWEEVADLLGPDTSKAQVERVMQREEAKLKLRKLEMLPQGTRRSLELLGTRVAILVDDRERLEPEDLAEANVVIYGKAPAARARLVGEQWFVSPGFLSDEGGIAIIEETGDSLRVTFHDQKGGAHGSETLKQKTKTKFSVQDP